MKRALTRRDFLKIAGTGITGTALLGAAGCGGGGGGGVTLQLAHNLPEANNTAEAMATFADLVSEKTGGEVTVQVFPAGQLYSDRDMVDAIPGGAVDMGMITLGQWTGVVPSVQIFDYPFLVSSYDEVFRLADGEVGNRLAEELESEGVTLIMWVDYGFVQFVNNERPVELPEDIEGLRMRTYSELGGEWLRILGAPPTFLGGSEVYTGLERGTIDGAITGLTSMEERAYYEVTDYVTVANPAYSMFALVANTDSWSQLSPEQQEAIMEASNEARDENRQAVQRAEEQAGEQIAEEGMEVYTVPDGDLGAWREAVEPVREIYLENTGQIGEELLQIAENL